MKFGDEIDFLGWETEHGVLSPAILTPAKILIVGSSTCGKTYFVRQLLKIHPFDHKIEKIYYYFMQNQPLYRDIKKENPGIHFIHGLPTNFPSHKNEPTLVILDDMINEMTDGKKIVDLFIRDSHHKNITCILISQNLFFNHKQYRLLSLQANYLILFRTPRDMSQVSTLSRQLFPTNPTFVQNVFWKVVKNTPYANLYCDLSQKCHDSYRIWSNVLEYPIVYPISMDTEFEQDGET